MGVPHKMKNITPDEVVRLLNEKKSMPKVARHLDMTESGLFRFMERHKIEKHILWVKAG